MFNPVIAAAHQDGRFQLNMSGTELTVRPPPPRTGQFKSFKETGNNI